MPEYYYQNKPLSAYSLWELGLVEKDIQAALARREEASKHPKFNVDRMKDGKKILKMPFPPPNVEFLKLKDAIEAEIKNRQELQAQKVNTNV